MQSFIQWSINGMQENTMDQMNEPPPNVLVKSKNSEWNTLTEEEKL